MRVALDGKLPQGGGEGRAGRDVGRYTMSRKVANKQEEKGEEGQVSKRGKRELEGWKLYGAVK